MIHSTTAHLLSQSSFWRLSKAFVETLGLVKGFIVTDLIDKSEYYKSVGKLKDGYFFYKREDMLKLYPVGETTLRNLLKELTQDDDLIDMRLEQNGLDRKTFFMIKEDNIQQLISKYLIEKSEKNYEIQ